MQSTDSGVTYTSLVSTIFTFTSATSPLLVVSTSSVSNVGSFTIKVTGVVGSLT
jgi:hypothetical protein